MEGQGGGDDAGPSGEQAAGQAGGGLPPRAGLAQVPGGGQEPTGGVGVVGGFVGQRCRGGLGQFGGMLRWFLTARNGLAGSRFSRQDSGQAGLTWCCCEVRVISCGTFPGLLPWGGCITGVHGRRVRRAFRDSRQRAGLRRATGSGRPGRRTGRPGMANAVQ
jgi:hypothetical protein